MVAEGGYLYVFGGTNGQNTLNDFWKFSLSSKRWELIKTENVPEVNIIPIIAKKRPFDDSSSRKYLFVRGHPRYYQGEKRCLHFPK